MTHNICEEMRLQRLLEELRITIEEYLEMFCDNQPLLVLQRTQTITIE